MAFATEVVQPSIQAAAATVCGSEWRARSRILSSRVCSVDARGAPRLPRNAAAAAARRRETSGLDWAAALQAKQSSRRATPRLCPRSWKSFRLSVYNDRELE